MAKRAEREAEGYFPLEGWDSQGNRVALANRGGVGFRGKIPTELGAVRGAVKVIFFLTFVPADFVSSAPVASSIRGP
ncbi:hypothetical protein A0H81_07566 [Grifola frondosa]|uniref:Uncharacterized protein n=1 Tax=Grifola frondosa TaxID=5627 RepID=A0A1C7MBL6_GRIFR|nr:hypothetical protein A0H81_07566 [Grifola frondosa]